MRLSDVKGERCLDVVADLIEPVATIAGSKEGKELFSRKAVPEGMDAREFTVNRFKAALPGLIKSHKYDIIDILSVIEGTPYEEFVNDLSLAKLVSDVMELLTDQEFINFLSSLGTETE